MTQEKPIKKLEDDIKKFMEVYKVLSSEGQAAFEAQMMANLKAFDPKTRKLYESLIQAAKDGVSTEEAIEMLNKASGRTGN